MAIVKNVQAKKNLENYILYFFTYSAPARKYHKSIVFSQLLLSMRMKSTPRPAQNKNTKNRNKAKHLKCTFHCTPPAIMMETESS